MLGGYLLHVPGALRLVVDDYVLGWNGCLVAEVLLDVVLDVAHEGLTAATGVAKLVLQHFHKWAVPREEDRWRRRLASGALNGEVVEGRIVDRTQANERLARTGHARDKHEVPRVRACGLVGDARDLVDGGLGLRASRWMGRILLSRNSSRAACTSVGRGQ